MAKPLGMCQVGIKSESIKKKMSNYELLYYTILTTKYIYYDFYKRKNILFMVGYVCFMFKLILQL